jgi:ssDNA-binding Zn-finger/Zn-ribbon topoisomerase 1
MAEKEDRWTFHVCPTCGGWLSYFGSKKHNMVVCRNKDCEDSEARKIEDTETKFGRDCNDGTKGGCIVCDKRIQILPRSYGQGGPESYEYIGHFLVHTECADTFKQMLEYESTILEKEAKRDFGN